MTQAGAVPLANVMKAEPDPAAANDSPKKMVRIGWAVVLFGFVGFLVWAAFAPLDQGVPAPGVVVVDGQRKAVQHPTGGLIQSIQVRDGVPVAAGDVLIRLNDVNAKAAKDVARSQWVSARANEARLASELRQLDQVEYPEELVALALSDDQVASTLQLQQDLLVSRREVFNAEISALEENMRGVRVQIDAIKRSLQGRERELVAVDSQRISLEGLARDGYVSRNRLLELERQKAQLEGMQAGAQGDQGRLMSQLAELKLAVARRKSEAIREAQSALSETRRDADTAFGRLAAAEFELANIDIRAPVDGVVVGMTVFTEGGVISGGDRLMDIVPKDQPLEVEAQVAVHLIDSVHLGLPVDLMFSALNVEVTPIVFGEVSQVSADRLIDEATGMPYYKATIRVTEEGVAQLKGQQIRPGMPVDVFIKTGERSFLNYLFKPLRDRASTALTEE